VIGGHYGVLVGDTFYTGVQEVLHGYDPVGKHMGALPGQSRLVQLRDLLSHRSADVEVGTPQSTQ
jgi:hypothetical protein